MTHTEQPPGFGSAEILRSLVALNPAVDVLDEDKAEVERGAAKHEEEAERHDGHVPEVEGRLEQARHA